MKQHTAVQSILYHLFPGVVVLLLILLFSQPVFSKLFGLDERLSPVLGFLLGLLFGLFPVQLGLLWRAGKAENEQAPLRQVIQFTERSSLKTYFILVPIFIVYFFLLFVLIAPLIQPFIIQTFFSWWPEQYNFQLLLQDPSMLAGYRGIKVLIPLYLLLSCITGPLVEELYFSRLSAASHGRLGREMGAFPQHGPFFDLSLFFPLGKLDPNPGILPIDLYGVEET